MVSRTIAVAIAVPTMAVAVAVSAQQTTYDYTGAPMGGIEVGSFIGPNGAADTYSYCCATLEGSVTFAAPLAPNLNNASVTPTAMSFSFTTIGGAIGAPPDAHAGAPYSVEQTGGPELPPYTNRFGGNRVLPALIGVITVSTNGAGEITGWNVDAGTPHPAVPDEWEFVSTSKGDSLTAGGGTHTPLYALSNSTAGNWVRRHSTLSRRSTELALERRRR